jgi:hypothetical protein
MVDPTDPDPNLKLLAEDVHSNCAIIRQRTYAFFKTVNEIVNKSLKNLRDKTPWKKSVKRGSAKLAKIKKQSYFTSMLKVHHARFCVDADWLIHAKPLPTALKDGK